MKTFWEYFPSKELLSNTYNKVISALYPADKMLDDFKKVNVSLRECGDELSELQQDLQELVAANHVVLEDAEADLRELELALAEEDQEKKNQHGSNVLAFGKTI